MQKVPDAVMEGPERGAQQGKVVLLIMEINPGVGNLLDAMVSRRGLLRMPTHYLGLVDNDLHLDWLQRTRLEVLRQKHFAGELTVPVRPQPSKENAFAVVREWRRSSLLVGATWAGTLCRDDGSIFSDKVSVKALEDR